MPESGLRCPCGIDPADIYAPCTCTCSVCVDLRARATSDALHLCTRHNGGVGAWLAESAFSRRASGTLQSWCRSCASDYARARRATTTEPTGNRATRRRTRATNPFDRPFGLEIEVIHSDMYVMRDAMRAVGLACEVEAYGHTTRRHWKIVTDASVSRGYEIVSPILKGSAGRAEARLAFQAIRTAGATVDRSCGLHVHHDAGDLTAADLERLVRTWSAEQGLIDGLVAPSRRGGCGWCHPLDSGDLDTVRRLARDVPGRLDRRQAARYFGDPRSGLRYRSLNFRVFSLHGTVEVRQHQGTVNATKALSWVLFAQAFIARCQSESVETHNSLRDVIADLEANGLESATAAYLSDRADAFAGQSIAA